MKCMYKPVSVRFAIIFTMVTFIIGGLFASIYGTYRDSIKYGHEYGMTAVGYNTEQLKTADGRILNCGSEIVENAPYMVRLADNNTPDLGDDIIMGFWRN